MDRILALSAATNLWLKRWSLHGIPVDKLVHVTLWVTVLIALLITVKQPSVESWATLFGVGAVLSFLTWAARRHNIIFHVTEGDLYSGTKRDDVGPLPLSASGRFLLWEGDRTRFARVMDRLMSGRRGDYWFLQVPVSLETKPAPLEIFSFVSWIDASERFLGIPLENKAGMWTIMGTFESLEEPAYGELLLGWKSMEGIRLRFRTETGRRRAVVLTCDSAEQLRAFYAEFAAAVSSGEFGGFRKWPSEFRIMSRKYYAVACH